MNRIYGIIRRNRLYVFLLLFIVGINVVAHFAQKDEGADTVGVTSAANMSAEGTVPERDAEVRMFDEEEAQLRKQRLQALSSENPMLYLFLALLNLTILFIMLLGLVYDIYFGVMRIRRRPLDIRLVSKENPGWTLADVVRVTLIFLFAGYVFVIVQNYVADFFPILNNDNFYMVFNTAFMNVVGIGVIAYFVIRKRGQDLRAIGITPQGAARGVLYACVGYAALLPVLFLIMTATFFVARIFEYQPPVQPIVQVFMEEEQTSVLWFSTVFAAVFGPVAEEIFFRGFMYPAVRKRFGAFAGIAGTSALFAFLHAHLVGFLPIMALGALLAYLYEKTGSIVPSIAVHVFHNLAMVMLVFLMRAAGAY